MDIRYPTSSRSSAHEFLAYNRIDVASFEDPMNGRVANYSVEGAKYGISFGTALAIAISYTNNHSVLWTIIHGFFSWLYVIYYVLFK